MLHRPCCWSPCPQTELRSYRPSNFMLSRASCISSMSVQAGPGRMWHLPLRGTLLRETHGAAAHTVARSPDTARDPEGRAHPRLHRRLCRPVRNGANRNRVPCVCSGIQKCPGSLPGAHRNTDTCIVCSDVSFTRMCQCSDNTEHEVPGASTPKYLLQGLSRSDDDEHVLHRLQATDNSFQGVVPFPCLCMP